MSARSNADELIRRPETKSFILTSEFWVAAGAATAVFLGGYVLDDIAETTAWRYGVWIAIAYIVSRGIAKAGSQRAYQPDTSASTRGATRTDSFWDGQDDNRRPEVPQDNRRPDVVEEVRARDVESPPRRDPDLP